MRFVFDIMNRLPATEIVCSLLFWILLAQIASAQLHAVSIEKLNLDATITWSHPRFSPDGQLVYLTSASFDGIWEYSPASKQIRQLTSDPGSGYGFATSPDGKNLTYRRTRYNPQSKERLQEIVVLDPATGTTTVVAEGSALSLPVYSGTQVYYAVGDVAHSFGPIKSENNTRVLGIEKTKIALLRNGDRLLFDPFGDGSYVWPSFSPDGTLLLAYEMRRGSFVSDLNGNIITRLGRKNAPVWSRDGKWIIYMNDLDDGHQIVSSEIHAISRDGFVGVNLTNTPDIIELYPQCSPTENKIVCSSIDGGIYLISYEESEK